MKFKIDVPQNVKNLISILEKHGHSAYIVGGCVRDSILNRVPHDWDICTSAKPNEMLEIFKDKRIIETGVQHGTLTVIENQESYEITTYRIDGNYSDNRRPDDVTFTDDIIEDLKRRDFTINAMAYNQKTGLIDPFNGMQDIKNKRIRCVGNPQDRFDEDALRILRAIRFAAQLDFTIEPNTDYHITNMCNNLKRISMERINNEFCKIVSSNRLCIQMVLFEEVISVFIPEIKDMIGFQQNNPHHIYDLWDHTIHAVEVCDKNCENDLIVKLSIFFHDIGKPHSYQDGEDNIRHFKGHGKVSADITNNIMKRLKFDNNTREKVVELVYYHDATVNVGKKYIRRWLNKIGEEQFNRLLKVMKADILAHNPETLNVNMNKLMDIEKCYAEVLSEDKCFTLKDLKINGNDLIEIGYEEGVKLGSALTKLLHEVIDENIENNKEELLKKAKEWLNLNI